MQPPSRERRRQRAITMRWSLCPLRGSDGGRSCDPYIVTLLFSLRLRTPNLASSQSIASARSLSFMARRRVPVISAPCSSAARANMTGPRSICSAMSIVAKPSLRALKYSRYLRSPWQESGFSPVRVTSPPMRLNPSRKAALDQSPSTMKPSGGTVPLCGPGILKPSDSGTTLIPALPRTSSVMPIYAALSSLPSVMMRLVPSSIGRASSSPVRYWLLDETSIRYVPGSSLPAIRNPSPKVEHEIPCSRNIVSYPAMPLSRSLGLHRKMKSPPRARAMGTMNRRVEPLSPQGSMTVSFRLLRALRQSRVRDMSSDRATPSTPQPPQ